MIAWLDNDAEPKTYRVTTFRALRMTGETGSVPADFDLHAYVGNAWSVFRGEPTCDVEILFSPEAAQQVAETKWHHTQQAKHYRDGSVTLQFHVHGLDEIVWWLLS